MDQATHNKIVSFLWGIADDVLRDLFKRGKYPDVILPMCVIRRMDVVLEPTKQKVLDIKRMLDKARITEQRAALCDAAGQVFYNTSKFNLRDLKSRGSQQQLLADFEDYLDGLKKASPSRQESRPTALQSGSRKHPGHTAGVEVTAIVDAAVLLTDFRELIQSARQRIATVANSTTALLYWHLGHRLLTESLRDGRAAYGKRILATVSRELIAELGQAFTLRSLYRAIQGLRGPGDCVDAGGTIELEPLHRAAADQGLLGARRTLNGSY